MKAYQYDAAGRYVGPVVCDASPLEPGRFLVPRNATETPPPEVGPGQYARHFAGQWLIENEPAPEPEAPEAAADRRRVEIRARLAGIDAESIRPAREISASLAAGQPAPAFAVSKLAALEAEAASLRAELAGL